VTIGQCVANLELIAKVYEPEDMANRVEPIRSSKSNQSRK
jgi:hypothetical protein